MNVERVLKLADVIEAVPHVQEFPSEVFFSEEDKLPLEGFNMAEFHCGTVGCIAGWAGHVFGGKYHDAEALLGISQHIGDELFIPCIVGRYTEITPAQAAAVLRHLAKTGRVNWSIAGQVQS